MSHLKNELFYIANGLKQCTAVLLDIMKWMDQTFSAHSYFTHSCFQLLVLDTIEN